MKIFHRGDSHPTHPKDAEKKHLVMKHTKTARRTTKEAAFCAAAPAAQKIWRRSRLCELRAYFAAFVTRFCIPLRLCGGFGVTQGSHLNVRQEPVLTELSRGRITSEQNSRNLGVAAYEIIGILYDAGMDGDTGLILIRQKGIIMATVMPEGEAIRKAVKWISAELNENPGKPLQKLVNEAVSRFDLSPKDSEFLTAFYRKAERGGPSSAD